MNILNKPLKDLTPEERRELLRCIYAYWIIEDHNKGEYDFLLRVVRGDDFTQLFALDDGSINKELDGAFSFLDIETPVIEALAKCFENYRFIEYLLPAYFKEEAEPEQCYWYGYDFNVRLHLRTTSPYPTQEQIEEVESKIAVALQNATVEDNAVLFQSVKYVEPTD